MFDKVWKEQIVQGKSKVGIFKPKQGFDLEEENEENCCEKAKEEWFIELKEYYKLPDLKQNIYQMDCLEFKRLLNLFVLNKDGRIDVEYLKTSAIKVLEEWEECENV